MNCICVYAERVYFCGGKRTAHGREQLMHAAIASPSLIFVIPRPRTGSNKGKGNK
jgi:hypothetical protein